MKPFISVVTPTYNRAHTLTDLFNSLQSQTFKSFEWVIADDGSSDHTEQLVSTFKSKAMFSIQYVKLQHNGKHNALISIKDKVNGKYIVSCDSDDTLNGSNVLQDIYDTILKLPKNKKFDAIAGCFIDQNNNISPKFNEKYIDCNTEKYLYYLTEVPQQINHPWVCTKEFWKLVVDSIPQVDDKLPFYPEIVSFLEAILKTKKFNYRIYNKPWYRYNMFNSDSVTVNSRVTDIEWYELVGIINLFRKYDLSNKYREFIKINLNKLGRKIFKKKGYEKTLSALISNEDRKYFKYVFYIRRFFKYFVHIDKEQSKTKFYLFGIKVYTKKNKILKQKIISTYYFDVMKRALDKYELLYIQNTRLVALKMILRNVKFIFKKQNIQLLKKDEINSNFINIVFELDGGLGDIIIALNYIQNFSNNFNNIAINLVVHQKFIDEVKLLLRNHNFVSNINVVDNTLLQQCDMYIRLVRFPIIKYVRQSRISRFDYNLIDWVNKSIEFCNEYPEYRKEGSVSDALLTAYSTINGHNRLTQANIIKYFPMSEIFKIDIGNKNEHLSKFHLQEDQYIVLQGGCGIASKAKNQITTTREWDIDNFSKLIHLLKEKYPSYKYVQVGYDNGLYMKNTDYNLCGKTNFEELLSIVNGAKLLISTEAGVVHFRHFSSKKKSVVLFGPTRLDVFGYDENININSGVCEGCEWISNKWREVCIKTNNKALCMQKLTPEMVMEQLKNKIFD